MMPQSTMLTHVMRMQNFCEKLHSFDPERQVIGPDLIIYDKTTNIIRILFEKLKDICHHRSYTQARIAQQVRDLLEKAIESANDNDNNDEKSQIKNTANEVISLFKRKFIDTIDIKQNQVKTSMLKEELTKIVDHSIVIKSRQINISSPIRKWTMVPPEGMSTLGKMSPCRKSPEKSGNGSPERRNSKSPERPGHALSRRQRISNTLPPRERKSLLNLHPNDDKQVTHNSEQPNPLLQETTMITRIVSPEIALTIISTTSSEKTDTYTAEKENSVLSLKHSIQFTKAEENLGVKPETITPSKKSTIASIIIKPYKESEENNEGSTTSEPDYENASAAPIQVGNKENDIDRIQRKNDLLTNTPVKKLYDPSSEA